MALTYNDNLKVNKGAPVDARYFNVAGAPYASVSEANTQIPVTYRYLGLTINVNKVEYWYKNGLTNADLILKTTEGSGTGTITGATNVGTGVAVYKNTSVAALTFKTLSAGTGIALSGGTNEITVTNLTHGKFLTYTGTTAPATYQTKASISVYTGTTAPNSFASKTSFSTYTGTTAPATYETKAHFNIFTGTTLPGGYYNKTQINAYTGTTATALNSKFGTANNGLTGTGTNVRLGGSLTGNTTITTATGSRLTVNGWPLMYATDLSANYSTRSLVDKGYVTGVTNTLLTKTSFNSYTGATAPAVLSDFITGTDNVKRLTVSGLLSYRNIYSAIAASVVSSTLNINMSGLAEAVLSVATTIASNCTITITETNGRYFILRLKITGTVAITMPSSFYFEQTDQSLGRWNPSTKVLTLAGSTDTRFEIVGEKDGSDWWCISSKYV